MTQLHDFVLGREDWDIFGPLIDFISSSSQDSGIFSNYTSEIHNSSSPDISKLKQFKCVSNNLTDIEDTSGILLSPNFPQDYPHYSHCGWNLHVPAGTILTLQFWAFDIEVKKSYRICIKVH